ncbi:MAG: prepilin-type N-terminal cleavage/methylation domain-containing protein [Candidatus Eremiobacteraeota bacterium]|nr:prepilin-type N-terminal cleavage/methylation domain-containing protein [Candidatus Eremiobacteraeota bacterium]MCW5871590.1 prepilin-type N-terminal cleavage/methylation domain-containing protein [Candidatus Eremiobacteraeota bacterium]
MRRRAFTVMEVLIVCTIFSMLSALLWFALRNVSDLWRQSDSKDDAVRELIRARTALTRDLRNASSVHFATAKVGPNLTGFDGDAVTFLSSDSGASSSEWNLTSDGRAALPAQITYYLVVPNPAGEVAAGPPDSHGYEQQDPYKWLVRRVDPGGTALNPAWNSWLVRPTSPNPGPNQSVLSTRLLGFRVLHDGPMWMLELSAVAIKDARHRGSLGATPLRDTPYTLIDRFSVRSQNI